MKFGNVEAVFMSRDREVTADNCKKKASLATCLIPSPGDNEAKTYNSVTDYTGNGGSHVNTVADDKVCRDYGHLVAPSVLLPNHPDIGRFMGKASVRVRCGL